jgi:hypothetical protein
VSGTGARALHPGHQLPVPASCLLAVLCSGSCHGCHTPQHRAGFPPLTGEGTGTLLWLNVTLSLWISVFHRAPLVSNCPRPPGLSTSTTHLAECDPVLVRLSHTEPYPLRCHPLQLCAPLVTNGDQGLLSTLSGGTLTGCTTHTQGGRTGASVSPSCQHAICLATCQGSRQQAAETRTSQQHVWCVFA